MIDVSGLRIGTMEVEHSLVLHPAVREAAVVIGDITTLEDVSTDGEVRHRFAIVGRW